MELKNRRWYEWLMIVVALPFQLNAQTFVEVSGGELDLVRALEFQDSCILSVEPFEISGLITLAQYQEFLDDFWSAPDWTLPDSNGVRHWIREERIRTDLGRVGLEACTNVTWIEAVEYSKWLTDNSDHIDWVYRLPKLSEWLFALNAGVLDQTDLGCWLLNTKDESVLKCSDLDNTYSSLYNDPKSLKRKMVAYETSRTYPYRGNYYQFIPYPTVGFRVVRVSVRQQ
ncbi:MAG: SUMF1/EgtB/PvdO family nonheme iron enzyme [Flavobacteriales bacterium]|nr:SUMF1/EgtB/PvdO family nonheme iron enzyme [Flavobacteriales bacterium]